MRPLWRKVDVARRFSVSVRTVERWQQSEELPCQKPFGVRGPVRYDPATVEAWWVARCGLGPEVRALTVVAEPQPEPESELELPPSSEARRRRLERRRAEATGAVVQTGVAWGELPDEERWECRRAVVRAIVDGGLSVTAVRRAAEAGQLGARPFRVPMSTARTWVRVELAERRGDAMRAGASRPASAG
jgi:hypothetical protein